MEGPLYVYNTNQVKILGEGYSSSEKLIKSNPGGGG